MNRNLVLKPMRRAMLALGLSMTMSIMAVESAGAADKGPFANLLGSWGGGGMASYKDGSKERLSCTAYYTGGGIQLRLAIQCKSPSHSIHMRGSVSSSGGQLSGQWEERTFNVGGSLSGRVSGNKLSMSVGGNMQGSMNVKLFGQPAERVDFDRRRGAAAQRQHESRPPLIPVPAAARFAPDWHPVRGEPRWGRAPAA